jgi:transposase
MKKIRPFAAGIDIGSKQLFVSVESQEVKVFESFTEDIFKIGEYLLEHNVATVAMEATGSYWFVLYDILVEHCGIDVWLVDGRQTKQLPGRKTDIKDCQWIQQLHSYGLLNRCYVSSGALKDLRSYQRMREDHIRSASMHVNHMQKALIQMNIKLTEVLSQVQGASGMRMIKAILAGERDRKKLLELCATIVKKNKSEQILKALEGHYTEDGLFILEQAHDAYFFYQAQIKKCDEKLSKVLSQINKDKDDFPTSTKERRKVIRHNRPNIDNLGEHLLKMTGGRDAQKLPGITDYTWLKLISEIGLELTKWPTEKHFTSWLGLSPGQHHSGKMRRNKQKGKPQAGQIFKVVAQSIIESKKTALGAFGRRLRAKKGPSKAIKAVARKIAILYWRLMVKGNEYVENGVAHYEKQMMVSKVKAMKRLGKELNARIEFS